jgi:hypothetical protein
LNEDIFDHLSPSARKMVKSLASSPSDAVHLINRAHVFRGLLLLDAEVMRKSGDAMAVQAKNQETTT